MYSLGEVLGNANPPEEVKESLHRTKTKIPQRPDSEVTLSAIDKECHTVVKTQKDPTDDLIELVKGSMVSIPACDDYKDAYIIWCKDTLQTWFAPTTLCLNRNFIYRDDLEIHKCTSAEDAYNWAYAKNKDLVPKVTTCKVCYLLDNPGNETYEVYFDSSYPSQHYGKSTPQGSFIRKYPNRFHRDMDILTLDRLYGDASRAAASNLSARKLSDKQAIIVSDGAWIREVCCYAFVYVDNDSICKVTESVRPSEVDQSVLIAEISGAYHALKLCYDRGKTDITYYYDNTSVLNVFKNRKTEYIDEIKRYKDLCHQLMDEGIKVNFVEIHPKTGEDRDQENRALVFFHNTCDSECRNMAQVASKKYKDNILTGNKDGQLLDSLKQKEKLKKFYNGSNKQSRGSYSGKRY